MQQDGKAKESVNIGLNISQTRFLIEQSVLWHKLTPPPQPLPFSTLFSYLLIGILNNGMLTIL